MYMRLKHEQTPITNPSRGFYKAFDLQMQAISERAGFKFALRVSGSTVRVESAIPGTFRGTCFEVQQTQSGFLVIDRDYLDGGFMGTVAIDKYEYTRFEGTSDRRRGVLVDPHQSPAICDKCGFAYQSGSIIHVVSSSYVTAMMDNHVAEWLKSDMKGESRTGVPVAIRTLKG